MNIFKVVNFETLEGVVIQEIWLKTADFLRKVAYLVLCTLQSDLDPVTVKCCWMYALKIRMKSGRELHVTKRQDGMCFGW
jgi:hypothetical protein